MKKKILKGILVFLIVLVVLLIINLVRNYMIIAKICESEESMKQSLNNYYYEQTTEYNMGNIKESKSEIYALNGIYLNKNYTDGAPYTTNYVDKNTDEHLTVEDGAIIDENTQIAIEEEYKNMLLTANNTKDEVIKNVILKNIFKPITKKDNQYIVKIDEFTVYINNDTNLIDKWESGDVTVTFKFESNVVTNEDVQKPVN